MTQRHLCGKIRPNEAGTAKYWEVSDQVSPSVIRRLAKPGAQIYNLSGVVELSVSPSGEFVRVGRHSPMALDAADLASPEAGQKKELWRKWERFGALMGCALTAYLGYVCRRRHS